ncbi:hypothetical protein NE237_005441 [Protea cynaroides]|uniref:Uncharacterized protein n=1 Tax=Protea cynaroides TaxID=273540 RepID=A0A9Q0QUK3_9MAGN|nr:hypothetical protein NE237_005441 [Protea cynaroides]
MLVESLQQTGGRVMSIGKQLGSLSYVDVNGAQWQVFRPDLFTMVVRSSLVTVDAGRVMAASVVQVDQMVLEGDTRQMRNRRRWYAKEKGKRVMPIGREQVTIAGEGSGCWEIPQVGGSSGARTFAAVTVGLLDIRKLSDPVTEGGITRIVILQRDLVAVLELPLRSGGTVFAGPSSSQVVASSSQGVSLPNGSPNTVLQHGVGVFNTVEKRPPGNTPGSGKSEETLSSRIASQLAHFIGVATNYIAEYRGVLRGISEEWKALQNIMATCQVRVPFVEVWSSSMAPIVVNRGEDGGLHPVEGRGVDGGIPW